MVTISLIAFFLAIVPTIVFCRNLSVFQTMKSPQSPAVNPDLVSVLVPARNEEAGITKTLTHLLASDYQALEIIVLDDHSEDLTAELVKDFARADSRVKIRHSDELPAGWCGKQFACWQLSKAATGRYLLFLDADVRIHPDAISKTVSQFVDGNSNLISCFPKQETGSLLERLLIPLIHFVLLGFLSIRQMRIRSEPAFAAGCGQFFFTDRESYLAAGGHKEIRGSLHDGIQLPRTYRTAGLRTDIFDGGDLATVRMYSNAREVWGGLQKNASEGLGHPRLIVPVSLLLFIGQILPFLAIGFSHLLSTVGFYIFLAAALVSWLPRFVGTIRFSQSWIGALLHPLGVLLLLMIQWTALIKLMQGKGGNWKGRSYQPLTGSSVVQDVRIR
ncbi:MAG: glycosyltransferase [Pirellulaceae bacterium]|nr:glycosyltransferase [Pirellulaceae bacterium]